MAKQKKTKMEETLKSQVIKDDTSKPEKGMFFPLEKLSGVYSNVAIIHHTKNEFILDFLFDIANQGNLVSRVITSPEHIKKLNNVLTENIKIYENKFGEIKITSESLKN